LIWVNSIELDNYFKNIILLLEKKTMAYLFINTVLDKEIEIALFDEKRVVDSLRIQSETISQITLKSIEEILKKNNLKLNDLKGILVVKGPGPFTSIRLGLSIANTFSYILKIPAYGIKISDLKNLNDLVKIFSKKLKKIKDFKLVSPFYLKAPNISKPKLKISF
jgi:hypothetical protein